MTMTRRLNGTVALVTGASSGIGEATAVALADADIADRDQAEAAVQSVVAVLGVARPGTAVYSLTKFGIGAFSEGVRQEMLGQRVRVGLVEPGTVQTEITTHLPPGGSRRPRSTQRGNGQAGTADIADAVVYMVTRDRRVAVNEILVRAAEQTW